jgi:hypothetical protein
MINKRRRGTVATENFMKPEIVEARTMKEAVRDFESCEYVFSTNKCRQHRYGTNQYQFEFPATWRTKSGGECVIGIRSIKLVKVSRRLNFRFRCKPTLGAEGFVMYSFLMSPIMTYSDVLTYLQREWAVVETWATYGDAGKILQWEYEPSSRQFIFQEFIGQTRGPDPNFSIWLDWALPTDTFDIYEFQPTYPIQPEPVTPYPVPRPLPPDDPSDGKLRTAVTMNWNHQDLLVTADFIQQADNQHLGFTGSEYVPLKEYNIKRNTPYFTIALWEDETGLPVELPEDGKDYVVIEAVISRSLI